jgi:hypothetical protein
MRGMSQITPLEITSWDPQLARAEQTRLRDELEHGQVLFMPHLPFRLEENEQRFLSTAWSDGGSKNISLENNGELKGARGSAEDLAAMLAMVRRFRDDATRLVNRLFPDYVPHLKRARTSLRVFEVEQRASSYRKDDKRLHVDAFPSRPTQGERILRVFSNINPQGVARVWRLGEPFADLARRFLPEIPRPMPGAAALMSALGITKDVRSEYDHIMLQLHDRMKKDEAYQRDAPQERVELSAGSTWIVFTDQVSHAAMSGQHMLEQTFHLPVSALHERDTAPLGVLENLRGRPLVA